MNVKELIEMLERVQDKEANVYFHLDKEDYYPEGDYKITEAVEEHDLFFDESIVTLRHEDEC